MPVEPPEDDDESWFRPPWETEDDETALPFPGGRPRLQKRSAEPDYDHRLLTPLARAENALARLEAKAEMVSSAVAEGLRARMACFEAAGWLRHAHIWIHPWDLALREYGGVTSYGAAARADRLAAVIPATIAQHADVDGIAETGAIGLDGAVNRALQLSRCWRRLAELRTWRPLADIVAVRKTLQSLGFGRVENEVIDDWLGGVYGREKGPDLIRAGRAAADWRCQPGVKDRDPEGVFLGACLWHEKNRTAPIPLPFWSASEQDHHRLELRIGVEWMAQFLECVAASALIGLRELGRLHEIEKKGVALGITARSRLPDAVDAVLRAPIVTAASLGKSIRVTPQAALGLLKQLTEAGIVREATGRTSWRAYTLI
jgi:hypothetical protein